MPDNGAMRALRALLLLALLPLACRRAGEEGAPVTRPGAQRTVRQAVPFAPPPGWRLAERAALGEPVAELERGAALIRLQLFGGPDSRYAGPAAFLAGPEARGPLGAPPRPAAPAAASGASVPTYERELGGAGSDTPPRRALVERFAVLAGRERFLVVSLIVPADEDAESRAAAAAVWLDLLGKLQITAL